MEELRVVSATVHPDTNEVEVVVEKGGDGFFNEDDRLFTLWLSAEEVVEKGQEWVKPQKS